MRSDYAMLSRLQLQSTSDQQEHQRYATIAAAAPAAIAPEQGAVWAYPQPDFTDDEIAFTLCNALLGRIHLSGHLNRMTRAQRALVAEAVAVYKEIRAEIRSSAPFWPLGLPGWTDDWVSLGLCGPETTYLTVWRRDDEGRDRRRVLSVPHLKGRDVGVRVLFPASSKAETGWNTGTGQLEVTLPGPGTACLVRLDG